MNSIIVLTFRIHHCNSEIDTYARILFFGWIKQVNFSIIRIKVYIDECMLKFRIKKKKAVCTTYLKEFFI